ncbi:MAG: metalloregulator ArsR/SmtB family transcription factor [Burkholderiales bacterium]
MDDALKALAEPRRRGILRLLKAGGRSAGEIASHFEVTRPAISQHLRVLARAGLVTERRAGTRRIYALNLAGLEAARALIEEFWDAGLPRLKQAAEAAELTEADGDERNRSGGLPRDRDPGAS